MDFLEWKLHIYSIVLLVILLSGCHGKTDEKEIVIISTNDIHGQFRELLNLSVNVDRDHIHERHSRTDSAIPETGNIRESSESETSERDSGGRGR